MRVGDEITIEPAELVAGGEALARVDGFPIFAGNVYPGDVARVRLVEVKKGFARAELLRIERPSPLRRAAPCPIAEECGGCDWTALRLDAQLSAKRRILTEALRPVGQFDSWPEVALHVSPLNYRLRSRLHEEDGAVGFYAMRSNRVVPLARECEVVGVETAHHPIPGETWEIEGRVVPASTPAGDAASSPRRAGRSPAGRRDDVVTILGYHLSPGAFFQVNRHLLETMLRRVGEIAARGAPHPALRFAQGHLLPASGARGEFMAPLPASGERVAEGRVRGAPRRDLAIDLYAGVGFFTRPLTKLFDRVIAVEGSPVSHPYAQRNSTAECLNAPVEQWVARMPEADFVFLDPPRAGARREGIDAVGAKAKRVCYLSCHPVTL